MNRLTIVRAMAAGGILLWAERGRSSAEDSLESYLRSPVADVEQRLASAEPDRSNPVEASICREFNDAWTALKGDPRFDLIIPRLAITTSATVSHPSGVMFVNPFQVSRWLKAANLASPDIGIRFLMGHEMAHMAQYAIFGSGDAELDKYFLPENQRIYEAQADILGALYCVRRGSELGTSFATDFADMVKLVSVLGDPEVGASTHPTPEKRRTAVRLGASVSRGLILARAPSEPERNVGRHLSISSGYDGGDVFLWSLILARQVVHFSSLLLADLNRTLPPESSVVSDGTSSVVHFKFSYRNDSTHTMHVLMTIIAGPADQTVDAKSLSQFNSALYDFWLDPGDFHDVRGVLPITSSSSCHLSAWPDQDSLTSAALF